MDIQTRGTLLEDGRFEDVLHDLIRRSYSDGVLSVYLDIDPATAGREGYEAELMNAFKRLQAREYDQWTRGRLEYEIQGVLDLVRSWKQAPGRSVAMFFSGSSGLAVILPLQFPMQSLAHFDARPLVGPLIAALEDHRRHTVVVFDKARARIITVLLGQIEEEMEFESDVLGKSAVGGYGGYLQSRYDRHRENQLHAHARRTLEHLWAIDRSRPIHTLIISGPPEAVAALNAILPRALARIAVPAGDIAMSTTSSDVVRAVEGVEQAARLGEDRAFVTSVLDQAGSHGAVLGWHNTVAAVADGRAHRLALIRGVTCAGVECPQCGFLDEGAATSCPRCSETLWQTDDLAEAAVRSAWLAETTVHYLTAESAGALAQHGIGALLRY